MKIISVLTFILLLTFTHEINANNFEPPIALIDFLIENAQELNTPELELFNSDIEQKVQQKNAFVAWILTYSIVGFHRLYLGTKFSTFAAYFITLGGFLIVDIIDYGVLLFALLENKSIDKYVDNPGFFMWN